ncbi:Putative ribonuclease H protein [Arachis hypogaea]|nr:Putative ribonuclease H protein [Arachis hypogaea]
MSFVGRYVLRKGVLEQATTLSSVLELNWNCVYSRNLINHPNALIRDISKWKKRNWQISFVNIYREGNRCADCLARKSLNLDPEFHFWDTPP